MGRVQSTYPLTGWTVTASLHTTRNGGKLEGTLTVPVVGYRANFTDLKISSYGVGFVVKFRTNKGQQVGFPLSGFLCVR